MQDNTSIKTYAETLMLRIRIYKASVSLARRLMPTMTDDRLSVMQRDIQEQYDGMGAVLDEINDYLIPSLQELERVHNDMQCFINELKRMKKGNDYKI